MTDQVERVARIIHKHWGPSDWDDTDARTQSDYRISAKDAIAAANQWLPIETAAEDGQEVILGEPDDTWAGYWENTPNHWGEVGWQCEDARQGHYFHRHPGSPTHWQPLPQPPETQP